MISFQLTQLYFQEYQIVIKIVYLNTHDSLDYVKGPFDVQLPIPRYEVTHK